MTQLLLTHSTHLLQAAGTPAGDAAERPYEADHFSFHVVLDLHVEAAQRATAVPRAAVVLLFGLVDLLAQAVLYVILVIGLKPNYRWVVMGGKGNNKVLISKALYGHTLFYLFDLLLTTKFVGVSATDVYLLFTA